MIAVQVITPERRILSDTADFVAAPAMDGEIGILPGHAPLLTQLGVGELRLKKGGETRYLALAGGFLEVSVGSRVSIFAETAEMADEIDIERSRLAAEAAMTRLAAETLPAEEMEKLEAALLRETARIKVGSLRKRRKPGEGRR